jgi:hypothetical protein
MKAYLLRVLNRPAVFKVRRDAGGAVRASYPATARPHPHHNAGGQIGDLINFQTLRTGKQAVHFNSKGFQIISESCVSEAGARRFFLTYSGCLPQDY